VTVAIERDAAPTIGAADPDPGRAPGLRWMYALIVVALAALGAGASQITFFVHDLGHVTSVQSCLLDHGIRLSDPALQDVTGSSAHLGDFAGCANPYNRGQGVVMLIGIAATLALAWLLMLISGVAMRRRLRHRASARTGPLIEAARARFVHWCDLAGLTGRHRPFLLLARPGRLTDQAFTTALPFSRPTVVIPVGYVHLQQDQLDVVLLHELAHVRSRDLTWASATWWAGWLNLPGAARGDPAAAGQTVDDQHEFRAHASARGHPVARHADPAFGGAAPA
jgi:Zn-dependent protease with chaperone function